MPGHRRNRHEVAGLDYSDLLADQAVSAPAQDHDGMHVLVPLQRGEAAGRDLEIAQFAVQLRIGEQHLPCDRFEQRAIVLLVRKLRHAFPAVILGLAVDRFIGAGHAHTHSRIDGLRRRRRRSLRAGAPAPRAAPRR